VTIDPKTIPAPIAYQILTGSAIPRPIGFIPSISAAGIVTLAPSVSSTPFAASRPW